MPRSETTDRDYGAAVDPPYLYPDYVGTRLRSPKDPLVVRAARPHGATAPAFGESDVRLGDADLTRQHDGRAARRADDRRRPGARRGRPAGPAPAGRDLAGQRRRALPARRRHARGAARSEFSGAGRALTDDDGRYRFVTIKPGAYPWRNHPNAWRPAHIHFSLFGAAFVQRLVTQMYFPGDPLLAIDPIFQSVPDRGARAARVAFDLALTEPELGARLPVRHRARRRDATPDGGPRWLSTTPSQTVGPYFSIGLTPTGCSAGRRCRPTRRAVWIRGRVLDGAGEPVPDGMVEAWAPTPPAATTRRVPRLRPLRRPVATARSSWRSQARPVPRHRTGRPQAPHLAMGVFARGLLKRLATRLYFRDEAAANAGRPGAGAMSRRRSGPRWSPSPDGRRVRFDIRLQGPGQTTFFAV